MADGLERLWVSEEPPEEEVERMRRLGHLLGSLPLAWQFDLLGIKGIRPAQQFRTGSPPGEGFLVALSEGSTIFLGDMADYDTLGHEIAHQVTRDRWRPPRTCRFGRVCRKAAGEVLGEAEEVLCDIFAWHWRWAWWSRGRPR